MTEHVQQIPQAYYRVQGELAGLQNRMSKLEAYLASSPDQEQEQLLRRQLGHMQSYAEVLQARITLFEEKFQPKRVESDDYYH